MPASIVAKKKPVVVVTGAAGALGSVIVSSFASRGERVIAVDKAVPQGGSDGPEVRWSSGDLTCATDVVRILDDVRPDERIAVLVNAVGMIWSEPILNVRLKPLSEEHWRRCIDANLTAPFLAASAVAARMARTGGGCIVNFSSIAARGNVGQVAYSAAKAGIEAMTKTMAAELGPLNIRVNAVAPGFINVPTTHGAVNQEVLSSYAERTPLARLGTVNEVVSAIFFLVDNGFVNGEILALDGGMRL